MDDYPQVCANCKWLRLGGYENRCCRFPESIVKNSDDWCGEFTPAPHRKMSLGLRYPAWQEVNGRE